MKITFSEYTNIGDREKNEDSIGSYCDETHGLFLLADGLGGHGKGEYASASAIRTCMQMFSDNTDGFQLESAFERCQEAILTEQEENPELSDMKTTLVALSAYSNIVKWAHIGDSRLYYFRKKKLISHTLDHSVPQMLVSMGEIKEKDIRGHEDRNRLLWVMGSPWNEKKYTISEEYKVNKPLQFLLCSDGFWENIVEEDIVSCLKKAKSPADWLRQMTDIVIQNGKGNNMDNNSAIAVWIEKD